MGLHFRMDRRCALPALAREYDPGRSRIGLLQLAMHMAMALAVCFVYGSFDKDRHRERPYVPLYLSRELHLDTACRCNRSWYIAMPCLGLAMAAREPAP